MSSPRPLHTPVIFVRAPASRKIGPKPVKIDNEIMPLEIGFISYNRFIPVAQYTGESEVVRGIFRRGEQFQHPGALRGEKQIRQTPTVGTHHIFCFHQQSNLLSETQILRDATFETVRLQNPPQGVVVLHSTPAGLLPR